MDEKDNKKSVLENAKTLWKSLPEAIKLLGTILSIAIAFKVLFPASAVGISFLMLALILSNRENLPF